MMNDQRAITNGEPEFETEQIIRDIHALTPPRAPETNRSTNNNNRRREAWETSSPLSSSLSVASSSESGTQSSNENFTTISREFNALVMAGTADGIGHGHHSDGGRVENSLAIIGENDFPMPDEINPLAIVLDNNPLNDVASASNRASGNGLINSSSIVNISSQTDASIHTVKREEVESKISAWQNAKIAKINNRFKREDAVINGWESEQVQKSTSWMKKYERKLEEKRARALEKMQNELAKAHRKAEERRASSEAKRGTKVTRVLEISNLMRAVGRPPVKRSFF